MHQTASEENYIKCIYHLQHNKGKVSTNLLADAIQTKPASVTDMLKKLQSKKLVNYEKYYGVKLSESGNRIALDVIRKHRLWECFLVNTLGFNWTKVHEVAEHLEHISNKELINRLDDFLGNPSIDPHGDPIPDQKGKYKTIMQSCLSEVPLRHVVSVSSIKNQSTQMLELLSHYNITIGTKIRVIRRFEFDGSAEIKINKAPLTIVSEQVAKNVYCII